MIESFIARRYLIGTQGNSFAKVVKWFSFIGISLGVATLIIVTSVMNGFRYELLDKIVGINGHIEITTCGNIGIKHYQKTINSLNKLKNISRIVPQIEQQAILVANNNTRGIIVQGVDKLQTQSLISNNIKYGNVANFKNKCVFIGSYLAKSLGVTVGDTINLLIPNGESTPFGNIPKEEEFKITGIFQVGMVDYDKNIILMPLPAAQDFFNFGSKISKLKLFLSIPDNAALISTEIAKILPNNFLVLDWMHSDASIFHAIKVEKTVMTLILSIIILVAMFNILSCLTMLSSNKIRDIAILRTMGITKNSILKTFIYIGSILGISGTLCGTALGLIISKNLEQIKAWLEQLTGNVLFDPSVYFLSKLPSKIEVTDVSMIVICSVILCFLATLYPAIKAAKADPISALKM